MKLLAAILAAGLFCILALPAEAHDISVSYAEISVEGATVDLQLTFNLGDFHELPIPDPDGDGLITKTELASYAEQLIGAILENYAIETATAAPDTQPPNWEATDGILRLTTTYAFSEDVRELTISSGLDRLTQPNHQHLLLIRDGTGELQRAVLDRTAPGLSVDLAGSTMLENFRAFLVLGLEHIVTGYDHLAFLAGLLLTTTTWRALAKVVTSFTIAHSITLALATFSLVELPGRLIEGIIALSIAYVAIENFLGKNLVHRWKITFLFGLIHGFGFSNILREMELSRATLAASLFSFNLGVEIGQLLFVLALFPAVYFLRTSSWKDVILSGGSLAIMSLGFYWFVERMLLP